MFNSIVDLLTQWHADLMNPDRIPLAMAAIAICAIIGMISGPVAGNANPLLWLVLDKIFGNFGDRLDKKQRARADLVFRGFLLTAFAMFVAIALGKAIEHMVFERPFYGLSEALALSLFMAVGSVWFVLLRLYFAMEQNQVGKGAYYAVSRSTRTNLTAGDDFGITRAAMNFSVRAFDKGVVSPVFWYLIGGMPLAILYSALAALSWRFGKSGFTKGFGSVALALERLMGFIPSLYSAVLITLASAFTPTAKVGKGLAAWMGAKNRAPYEQGGLPLSALAWALNVSLGGASQDLTGSAIKSVWTGPEGASAQLNHKHLRRAIYISVMAHILLLASLLGAYLWAQGAPFEAFKGFSVFESLTF